MGLVDWKAAIFILFTLVSQHLQQCLAYNMCSVIFVDYVIPGEHKWRSSRAIINAEPALLPDVNIRKAELTYLKSLDEMSCPERGAKERRRLRRQLWET